MAINEWLQGCKVVFIVYHHYNWLMSLDEELPAVQLAVQELLLSVGETLVNRFSFEDELIQQVLEYSIQTTSIL